MRRFLERKIFEDNSKEALLLRVALRMQESHPTPSQQIAALQQWVSALRREITRLHRSQDSEDKPEKGMWAL